MEGEDKDKDNQGAGINIMAQARKTFIQENLKRAKLEQPISQKTKDQAAAQASQDMILKASGVELDPMAKSLFERLPVPSV